jgi:CheY-like chemotaxis protein
MIAAHGNAGESHEWGAKRQMSLEREARVLIVDDQREVARVLRTALELSEKAYYVIDVPSGEEALLELGQEFDVIVSDYRLPGMSGPELLRRVRKVQSGIKMIMITGSSIKEVQAAIKDLEIFRLFEKPIDTTAFVDAVEVAIHGEQIAAKLKEKESILAPIPEFKEGPIVQQLSTLLIDLGARGIAFINRSGKVMLKQGPVDDVPRFGELAVLLANNFTTTAEISSYLGDEPSSAVHHYDGNWYDIYALSAGVHFFIAIVYPGGSQKEMGPVLRYGRPAVRRIVELIGEGALTREPKPAEKEARPAVEPRIIEAPAAVEVKKGPAPAPVEEPAPVLAAEPSAPDFETLFGEKTLAEAAPVDLGALDLDLGADLGDLDSFWEEAGALSTKVSDDALSLDEAVELGLVPKDVTLEE